MIRATLLLLLTLPLAAEDLRLLSYNVKHAAAGIEPQLAIINDAKADIVGLQEIDKTCTRSGQVDQPAEFAKGTSSEAHFGAFMPFQGGEYGVAMLSKLTVHKSEVVRLPDGREPRVAIVLEVETRAGYRLLVANVHFDWTTEELRTPQAQTLINYLDKQDLPAIVLGDYNAKPGSPTLELFRQAGFVFAPKPPDARFTFNAIKPSVEIDHVATRGTDKLQLSAEARVIPETKASDHRPVLATVRIVEVQKSHTIDRAIE